MCQGLKSAGMGREYCGRKRFGSFMGPSTRISFALFYSIFMLSHWMVAPGARYNFNTYSAGVSSEPSQADNVMSTDLGPLIGQRETSYVSLFF